jgi:outer membrane receptor protein involved in Fe transport
VAVDAHVATLTGGVRVLGPQYRDVASSMRIGATTLVDAMAARPLPHGLAGFVSVENLLDRRYVGGDDLPGLARTVQIGVRLDTTRL